MKLKLCQSAGHGFGLGTGTDAEGWLDEAGSFWEEIIRSEKAG